MDYGLSSSYFSEGFEIFYAEIICLHCCYIKKTVLLIDDIDGQIIKNSCLECGSQFFFIKSVKELR